jgi:hypothetical protein
MTWRDTPQDTEIIFIGGGQVIVREDERPLSNVTLSFSRTYLREVSERNLFEKLRFLREDVGIGRNRIGP